MTDHNHPFNVSTTTCAACRRDAAALGAAILTKDQLVVLRDIVADWIGEGFTTPPYSETHYDIFDILDLENMHKGGGYDIRRPGH